MKKISVLITAMAVGMVSPGLQADVITEAQNEYRSQGSGPYLFERGEALWNSRQYQNRSCVDCHGTDLRKPGRHQRTNKSIEPMAPSVAAGRYTDAGKMEKWFKRNCQWTWDRECTPQEKGDLLEYLRKL